MSQATADPRLIAARTAPKRHMRLSWSDPMFRSIVWQVVIVGAVALILWYLISNTTQNLAATPYRHRVRLPRAHRRNPDRRAPDRLRPGGEHLWPSACHRRAEHPEGRDHRHRAGHHPRHPDRHRPAVEELAAGQDHCVLRRDDSRHPGAAATAVLVHGPAGSARSASGPAYRPVHLPDQPRDAGPAAGVAAGAHGGAARLHCRRDRHRHLDQARAPPAGRDRHAPRRLGPSRWVC